MNYLANRVLLPFLISCSIAIPGCLTLPTREAPTVLPAHTMRKLSCASLSVAIDHDHIVGSATLVNYRNQPYVLTAAHVVLKQENGISVLEDGIELVYSCLIEEGSTAAKVLYLDEKADIAVLLPYSLPPYMMYDAAKISKESPDVGTYVVAIGNPVDFKLHQRNVTAGIISGIETCQNGKCYRTDADIFFGNSGGGLFNLHGEYVGMNVGLALTPFGGAVPGSGIALSRETILKHLRLAHGDTHKNNKTARH